MTLAEFSQLFAVLALQLRATDADEATIRSYYEALKHLEFEYVQMAAKQLAQTAEWFPKTSEWREATARIEHERREYQRALLRKMPSPLCLACEDTGWDRTEDDRVHRCSCRELRRLELLGRRPWPQLTGTDAIDVPGFPEQKAVVKHLLEAHDPRR